MGAKIPYRVKIEFRAHFYCTVDAVTADEAIAEVNDTDFGDLEHLEYGGNSDWTAVAAEPIE